MQDLLDEKDFIKKPYNPWPRFLAFYGIEVVAFVANILLMLLANFDTTFIAMATITFIPVILAPIMLLTKRNYKWVTNRQASTALVILFSIYLCPILLSMLPHVLASGIDSIIIGLLLILIILYTICFTIVLAIFRDESRKLLPNNNHN